MRFAVEVLVGHLRQAFGSVRWLVEGLTDEEFFWEPVPGCWSVRRREDARKGWGAGAWVCEDDWPPPDPLPVTTIAWRLTHLCAWTDIYRGWTFEGTRPGLMDVEVPGSVAGTVAWLERSQDAFEAEVTKLRDEDLNELRPAHFGPMLTIEHLVWTMGIVEHIHHGAEIGALRDLHRGHARNRPLP